MANRSLAQIYEEIARKAGVRRARGTATGATLTGIIDANGEQTPTAQETVVRGTYITILNEGAAGVYREVAAYSTLGYPTWSVALGTISSTPDWVRTSLHPRDILDAITETYRKAERAQAIRYTTLASWTTSRQNLVPSGMVGVDHTLYSELNASEQDFLVPLQYKRHWDIQRSTTGSLTFMPLYNADVNKRVLIQGWRLPIVPNIAAGTHWSASTEDGDPDWVVAASVESILKSLPPSKENQQRLDIVREELREWKRKAEGDREVLNHVVWVEEV